MADKRIDAHTNTTTVADVDEFIVDSGSNGTRNITYSNLKTQILGTTSIAAIGNTVTEAIYNVHMDQAVPKIDTTTGVMYLEGGSAFEGNIDSTPTAGSNNAVSSGGTKTYVDNAISELNAEIDAIDTAKADIFVSQTTAGTTHSINVGTVAVVANRMFLLSSGYPSTYVFGLVFITSTDIIRYIDISHSSITVDSITYSAGVVTITLSSTTYTRIELIRLC